MDEIYIDVADICWTTECMDEQDGNMLNFELDHSLSKGKNVTLNFGAVTKMTSVFLEAAIGNLYELYKTEVIEEKLKFVGLDPVGAEMVRSVVNLAKDECLGRGVSKKMEVSE